MKHNLIALSFASLALFAGCEKENEGGETRTDEKYVTVTLSASCGDDTKTVLDGFNVKWKGGDNISVFIDGVNCEFTADQGGLKTTFTGKVPESKVSYDGNIYAVYPYASDYTIDKGVVSGIEVPAVQDLTAGSYDPKAGVSVATGTVSGGLKFKNVCALLKIKLNAETAVRGAQLTCPSGFALAGKGLSVNAEDATITFPANYAGCSNTVNLINNTKEGVTGKEFYIALVPGEYFGNGDYKLSVFNAEEKFASKTFSTTDNKQLVRNKIASITSAVPANASYVHYGTANCISLYGKAAGEKVTIDVTPYIASDSFIATGLKSLSDNTKHIKSKANVWREDTLNPSTSVTDGKDEIVVTVVDASEGKVANKGNMVISAYNGSAIWSFHIWSPVDNPENLIDYKGTKSDYKVMPMALGAINSTEGDLSGLLYQWGRKDPLSRLVFSNTDGNSKKVSVGTNTNVFKNTRLKSETTFSGNLSNSISNPNAFIYGDGGDWAGEEVDELWGNPEGYSVPAIVSKSIYDPCPDGYMVAPSDVFVNVISKSKVQSSSEDYESEYLGTNGYLFEISDGKTDHIASTGSLSYKTGYLDGNSKLKARYWLSSPSHGSANKGANMYFDNTGNLFLPTSSVEKGAACCVRCVKVK